MAIRDEDIRAWLSANQGLSDKQIADAMKQHGVSPTQLANAVGANAADVQARYDKATAIRDEDIRAWLSANQGLSDKQIADAMKQHGVSPTQLANAVGANAADVQARYDKATATSVNEVPVSSPAIIDQGAARPPRVNPRVAATTTARDVLCGGVPQQPRFRQPWMDNPIPPQYQQMTMQQPPPLVQQMQSWGRQQPQQQAPQPSWVTGVGNWR